MRAKHKDQTMPNIIKQKAFNERMGKASPRHMKRKSFAAGGATNLTSQANPSVTALGGSTQGGVTLNATNPNTGIAGTIDGALGLNNNFQAGAANLQQGTNGAQLNNAYTGAQQGLTNQNNLANTFIPGAENAVANQNAVAQQQLAMLNGQGPNPAQAQLAQATGQNVANQAALMAGQRGASANAGLIAREAAQQGAQTQQQAVGQAATLEAQQQIAAQQNLANLAAQQAAQAQGAVGGQNQVQQGEQNILQGANTALNNANVSQQSNINSVNAGTAIANQQQSGNIIGGLASGLSGVAGSIGNAIGSLFSEGGEVSDHVKLAEMNAHALGQHKKNFATGGATISSNPLTGNQTGQAPIAAPIQAPGGAAQPAQAAPITAQTFNPQSAGQNLSNGLSSFASALTNPSPGSDSNNEDRDPEQEYLYASEALGGPTNIETDFSGTNSEAFPGQQLANEVGSRELSYKGGEMHFKPHPPAGQSFIVNHLMSEGGEVPARVSPGERYLRPDEVKAVLEKGANPFKLGRVFPGHAKVKGDSKKNDTIDETLQEGGMVIKRSIEKTKDPDKARLFIHQKHMKRP